MPDQYQRELFERSLNEYQQHVNHIKKKEELETARAKQLLEAIEAKNAHTMAVEFAMWLAGAADMADDSAPTPEQWAKIRERLSKVVSKVALERLLDQRSRPPLSYGFEAKAGYTSASITSVNAERYDGSLS